MINSEYVSVLTSQRIWTDFTAHFRSSTTKASYASDLSEIMNYFEKDIVQIGESDAQEYFHVMQNRITEKQIKPATVAKKFRELHSFAEYICENREKYGIDENFRDVFYPFLKLLEKQKKFAKSVSLADIDRLLQVAKDDIQAYTIIVLLYRAGLTSTEITGLKAEDFVRYENGVYAVVEGRKQLVYIPDDAAAVLERFMEFGQNRERFGKSGQESQCLFCNSRGNQLNLMYISRLLRKLGKKAGVEDCSAQSIRNACGFTLYAYGAESEQVAEQLGVTLTQIHRYKNETYRDGIQRAANELVRVRVVPPDNTYKYDV